MFFAVDVGNTNITFALFDNDKITYDWRVSTLANRTADEYAALFLVLFDEHSLSFSDINGVAISSVVPGAVDALVRFAKKHLKVNSPLVLSNEVDLGINILYKPASDVGADRLSNAIAAHQKYGGKVIIVDFGTATTLDAVSENGDYLGGAISPGIQISLDALFKRAARLTNVPLISPEKAIGDTTISSLQSGIVYGYAGQVDALVERFQVEMGGGAKVIATGGLGELIAPHSKTIEIVDELLTLEGLKIIYDNR